MKNLFDASQVQEVKQRMALLRTDSARLWGKMSAPQAMAHCSVAMEWAVGDRVEPRMFLGRFFGPLVKSQLLCHGKQ